MRVAQRMHVTHRARDLAGRDLQDFCRERRVEIAVRARLNARVAALLHQRRQPSHLELAPDRHQQLRIVQLEDEAGLRLDEVRILIAARQSLDLHLVTADLAHDRREVLGGGNDLYRSRRAGRRTS